MIPSIDVKIFSIGPTATNNLPDQVMEFSDFPKISGPGDGIRRGKGRVTISNYHKLLATPDYAFQGFFVPEMRIVQVSPSGEVNGAITSNHYQLLSVPGNARQIGTCSRIFPHLS